MRLARCATADWPDMKTILTLVNYWLRTVNSLTPTRPPLRRDARNTFNYWRQESWPATLATAAVACPSSSLLRSLFNSRWSGCDDPSAVRQCGACLSNGMVVHKIHTDALSSSARRQSCICGSTFSSVYVRCANQVNRSCFAHNITVSHLKFTWAQLNADFYFLSRPRHVYCKLSK